MQDVTVLNKGIVNYDQLYKIIINLCFSKAVHVPDETETCTPYLTNLHVDRYLGMIST